MFGTIQVRLNVSDAVRDYLIFQCQQSNSLINCTLFQGGQTHFETCERIDFFDKNDLYRSEFKTKFVFASYAALCKLMSDNPHYKMLGGQCAQQTIKSVVESFNSFNGLLKLFWQGEGTKPRMPGYRTKGGLAPLCYPAQAVQFDIETGQCRLPVSLELGDAVKALFGVKEIWVNGCTGIYPRQVVEVRILPRNNELYVEYVYKYGNNGATCNLELDHSHALGIDPGIDNWMTCVTTKGKSFIIDGRKLKSINQNYNRRIDQLKTGKPQGFWNEELSRITEKRASPSSGCY